MFAGANASIRGLAWSRFEVVQRCGLRPGKGTFGVRLQEERKCINIPAGRPSQNATLASLQCHPSFHPFCRQFCLFPEKN